MNRTVRRLLRRKLLTPRSWFVFVADFTSDDSFSFFTKYYISQVVAINKIYALYTIDPYKYEDIRNPENYPFLIGNCSDIFSIKWNIHFNKYPKRWRNTTVREYFRTVYPYTNETRDGIEDKMLDIFEEKLQFKVNRTNVSFIQDTKTDRLVESRQKEKLQNYEIDIFGGFFTLRLEDTALDYDITPAYLIEKIIWLAPNSPVKPAWLRVVDIFNRHFYFWLFVTLVGSCVLAKLVFDVGELTWMGMLTKIVLEHPILKQRALERLSMKINVTGWVLAMMTTSAIFKNSLIIITASTMRLPQIETMEDILQSGLKIMSGLNLSQYYDDLQYEYCNHMDCIKRTAFQKDAVVPSMEISTTLYYIPLYFTNSDGQSIIHVTKEVLFTKTVHMIFTKGHPLFRQCQRIILQSVQNGWFVKTMNDLKTSVKVRKFELHRERKISFENVAFIFICWGCGVVDIFNREFYLWLFVSLASSRILTKFVFDVGELTWMGMITKIVLEHPILKQQALERLSMKINITDWLLAMMTTSAIFKNSLIIITASTMTSLISSGLNLSQYYDDFQYEYCNNIDCIKRSAFEKDAVAPSMEIGTSLYYIPLYFTSRDGQSIIHITKEVVFTKMVHMIFTKGHPLFGQCQRIILQSVQNRWFVKIINELKTSAKGQMTMILLSKLFPVLLLENILLTIIRTDDIHTQVCRCSCRIVDVLSKIDKKHAMILTNYGKCTTKQLPKFTFSDITNLSWPKYTSLHIYAIEFETIKTDNKVFIKQLKDNGMFFPKAMFIYTVKNVTDIDWSIFPHYYITNLYAIDDNFDIYTYNPYENENIDEPNSTPIKIGTCLPELSIAEELTSKGIKKWRNTTLKYFLNSRPPFATENGNGLDNNLIKLFQWKLGVDPIEAEVVRMMFVIVIILAVLFQNSTEYDDVFRQLMKREIDLFGGFYNPNRSQFLLSDVSPAYMFESKVWVTPTADPISIWIRVTRIFAPLFYFYLIIIFLVSLLLARGLFRIRAAEWTIWIFQVITEQPIHDFIGRSSKKFLLGIWCLGMITCTSIFKNTLIIIHASTESSGNLDTLEKILESGLTLISPQNISSYYATTKDLKFDLNAIEYCDWDLCLNRTAYQRDSAVPWSESLLLYHKIPMFFTDDNGYSLLYDTKVVVFSKTIHMCMTRGHPLYTQISNIIMQSFDNGWISKQLVDVVKATEKRKVTKETSNIVISMKYLQFVFKMWFIGLSLALFVFCVEYMKK
ncbi:hypothetical protein GWI33_009064 [Rhynchophorus ferrugineus]|uniref:Uncharacterized protein n=1 Tax=Rhynchophorus ferrugineus TaxID=354439 RepID=A0A834MBU2_RHYFE|nr:hypothetical protein GWI33_009064 [Rhynchophorus ferrugineus]